jgi:hypothetical protein
MQTQHLLVQVDMMSRQIKSMRQEAADATDPAVAAAFTVIANEYSRRLDLLKAEALISITSQLSQPSSAPEPVVEPVMMSFPTPNPTLNTTPSNS